MGRNVVVSRDPTLRDAYLSCVLAEVPRLLTAVDRCPVRKTYGCFDREYWHYRTSSFPSEMYQEAVLPLALIATVPLPGNRWHGEPLLRELAIAGIRFAARTSHTDGSCDDYYPYERALGAAVFSLQATTRAYQLLELDDAELTDWFLKRAEWIASNDESGRLTNHHALAALGLIRTWQITGNARCRQAAQARIRQALDWQHEEGWFDEYGGADPGYQTVTIDCLAQYQKITGDTTLDEPLRRAVRFARRFLHPDRTFGGEYGSRGTRHFYAHGMELLAKKDRAAAELADGFLRTLRDGTAARFTDDRLYAHRLASMLEAWQDYSPECSATTTEDLPDTETRFFPAAGILVERQPSSQTIIAAARGGVFKFFGSETTSETDKSARLPAAGNPSQATGLTGDTPFYSHTDAGLVVETTDSHIAVSQQHGHDRAIHFDETSPEDGWTLRVEGILDRVRFETITPAKQILLFGFMLLVGRWCRGLVRRLLQRRLITGRRPSGIRLERTFERRAHRLKVTDRITLLKPRLKVRRISYAVDLEAKYTAAADVFQRDALQGWQDLEYVETLNRSRSVEIVREFSL